jgi:hypothetical protein
MLEKLEFLNFNCMRYIYLPLSFTGLQKTSACNIDYDFKYGEVRRQTPHEEVVAAVTTQASFKLLVYTVTRPASAEIVGVNSRQTMYPV